MAIEIGALITVFVVRYVFLRRFDAGLPLWAKSVGFALTAAVALVISAQAGRGWFFAYLAASALPTIIYHGWWLPRHGVNGWTCEPRERYFALRGRKVQV